MLHDRIQREEPLENVFTPNVPTSCESTVTPEAPISGYCGYLDPREDDKAAAKGERLVAEIKENIIADFEKNIAYCEKNGAGHPDRMVHVSTFKILNGIIYMTYYANTATANEDPIFQEARLAFCPMEAPQDMTIVTVQKVGEPLGGKTIDRLYDTILLYKGGDELFLMWTASADGLYYRLYCTFNMATNTLGAVNVNRFQVGDVVNDFSTTGIKDALACSHLPCKRMFSDIGIMQKLTERAENGVTFYYTGAYSGLFNCIIKSRDFITWEYVSAPDFINLSKWENATYVLGDKCFYFVRQTEDCCHGFLTYYDLSSGRWAKPFIIRDTQSRSDFVYYRGKLYLMHAPVDRDGIGIVEVDTEDISRSKTLLVANMHDSIFYPFWDVYGDDAYISYTVARKHIRLSKFHLSRYTEYNSDFSCTASK